MRKIAFDLTATQPNSDGEFHGGGKYAKKVFLELIKKVNYHQWTIFPIYDSRKAFDDEIHENLKNTAVFDLIDVSTHTLKEIISKYSIDRFYTALPFSLIEYGFNDLIESRLEIYVTIHGLRPLEMPIPIHALDYAVSIKEKMKNLAKILFERRLLKREVNRYRFLAENTKVITVSNHTKYSLLASLPNLDSNIDVFYSPDVTEFKDVRIDKNVDNFNENNYFLMVSGNRWLKNNLRSAIALDRLFTQRNDLNHKVIITGVSNPEVYLKKIKNKHRFIFYPYVSESFLQLLYQNAFAFVYLTLNEGFGYPPLEAMKHGIPVITTPHTSIPEICGDAVLYADPSSTLEIMNRLLNLLMDSRLYQDLVNKSKFRYNEIYFRQKEDLTKMVCLLLS